MAENPDQESDLGNVPSPLSHKKSLSSVIINTIVLLAIICIVIVFLLPAKRGVREVARRNQCLNNLKQIAIALQNYADVHHALPPAYTTDANGKPLHSWRTLILPFMEEQQLYEYIDLTKPWDDPANARARNTPLSFYGCPSADIPETHTTYLAIVTPTSCLQPTTRRSLSEIKDGGRQTLMLIEVDAEHAVPWMSPVDADENLVLSLGEPASRTRHPNGMSAAFADGHTEFLLNDVPADQRRAMISVAGNDKASAEPAE